MGAGGTPLLVNPGQPSDTPVDPFVGASVPNEVSFGFHKILPPSNLYLQRDDILVVQGNTTLTGGDVLTVALRLLKPKPPAHGQPDVDQQKAEAAAEAAGKAAAQQAGGKMATAWEYGGADRPSHIERVTMVLPLPTAGTTFTLQIPLSEGYLLSLAISAANSANFGQTYASAFVGQSAPAGQTPVPALMLVADYPTSTIPVGWPGVNIRQTAAAQGVIASQNPAGANLPTGVTVTMAVNTRTLVHAITFNVSTNATVSNRYVTVQFYDSAANLTAQISTAQAQPASTTWSYSFALGLVTLVDGTNLYWTGALPNMYILNAGKFRISGVGGNAGDTIGTVVVETETWVA